MDRPNWPTTILPSMDRCVRQLALDDAQCVDGHTDVEPHAALRGVEDVPLQELAYRLDESAGARLVVRDGHPGSPARLVAAPTSYDAAPSGARISTTSSSRLSYSTRSALLMTACMS